MGSLMKTAVLVGVGLFVAAVGTARADVMHVKVPFAFVVNGETLPAGSYRVERHATNGSVVLISGAEGSRARMFVVTTPETGPSPAGTTPALVFEPYETDYRLIAIWESARQGHELPGVSASVRQLARTIVFGERVS